MVDDNEQFREENFVKLQDTFSKHKLGDVNKGTNGRGSGRIAKGGNASGGSDISKIVKVSFPIRRFIKQQLNLSNLKRLTML